MPGSSVFYPPAAAAAVTSTPIKQSQSLLSLQPAAALSEVCSEANSRKRVNEGSAALTRKNSRRSQPLLIRQRRLGTTKAPPGGQLRHSPSLDSIPGSPIILRQGGGWRHELSVVDGSGFVHDSVSTCSSNNDEHERSCVAAERGNTTAHHSDDASPLEDIDPLHDGSPPLTAFVRGHPARRTFPIFFRPPATACLPASSNHHINVIAAAASTEKVAPTAAAAAAAAGVSAVVRPPPDEPSPPPAAVTCLAIWDHVTCDPEELAFSCGDVIEVVNSEDKNWWLGRLHHRQGWFPTAFVQDSQDSEAGREKVGMIEKLRKRALCIKELLHTERTYLMLLQQLIQFYQDAFEKSRCVKPSESVAIFCNIHEIYQFHKLLLTRLESCAVSDVRPESRFHEWEISRVFRDVDRIIELYSAYCNNHQLALQTLRTMQNRKAFCHLLEKCRKKHGTNLTLDSFLLSPIQKICRYQLQLSEILKNTPSSHSDFDNLRRTTDTMKNAVFTINEKRRSSDRDLLNHKSVLSAINNATEEQAALISRGSEKRKSRKLFRRFLSNPSI